MMLTPQFGRTIACALKTSFGPKCGIEFVRISDSSIGKSVLLARMNAMANAIVLPKAVYVLTDALSIAQEITKKAPSDALKQLADLAFEARKPYQY